MFERYTEEARRIIIFAREDAGNLGAALTEPEHLLLGLLRENEALLGRFSSTEIATIQEAAREIATPSRKSIRSAAGVPFSHAARRVLAFSAGHSETLRSRQIRPEDLLLGLLREPESKVPDLLGRYGIEHTRVLKILARPPEP